MCIGRPLCVVEMHDLHAVCADPDGRREDIDMALVGAQPPGTWVLTFLGHARGVLSADDAARIRDALSALDAVMRGDAPDVEHLFADLVADGPRLPDHLRGLADPA